MDLFAPFVSFVLAVQQLINPGQPVTLQKKEIPNLVVAMTKPKTPFGKLIANTPLNVLGVETEIAAINLLDLNPGQARKKNYIISLLGDSMIDTLGTSAANLGQKLQQLYPDANFVVKNHGVGAENIDSGLYRLTNGYRYLGVDRPSVLSEKPDIIVLESFAYNPYAQTEGALDRHWLQMAEIVRKIKSESPGTGIVIAATIGPNANVFADGSPDISFSATQKREKVKQIKQYLESTLSFAKGEHLPFADAYTPSLELDGNGKLALIDKHGHIHYSDAGREFFSDILAASITTSELLE